MSDMRLGVRDELVSENNISDIALQQFDEWNVAPIVVGLVGQKYGPRGLPTSIPQDEFDRLVCCLSSFQKRHL